jgi:Xaa-Pro aminopeptidase
VVEDGKIQKMGKYVKLLISLFQKGGLQLEDTYLITDTGFEKFTEMKDEVYRNG